MPAAIEEALERILFRADRDPGVVTLEVHHLTSHLEEQAFALVGDGEDVGGVGYRGRRGMVGFGLKVIVEGVARVDIVAEMDQFQGILDDQGVFRRVAHIELDDFIILVTMGRLHVEHAHPFDLCSACRRVKFDLVAVHLAPGDPVRAPADRELLHGDRLGQFKGSRFILFQLQFGGRCQCCRPVGGGAACQPRVIVGVAVGEIVLAQKIFQPHTHHLVGVESCRLAWHINPVNASHIAESGVIVVLVNPGVVGIHRVVADDCPDMLARPTHRIGDVCVIHLNTVAVIGSIIFIVLVGCSEYAAHVFPVGAIHDARVVTVLDQGELCVAHLANQTAHRVILVGVRRHSGHHACVEAVLHTGVVTGKTTHTIRICTSLHFPGIIGISDRMLLSDQAAHTVIAVYSAIIGAGIDVFGL